MTPSQKEKESIPQMGDSTPIEVIKNRILIETESSSSLIKKVFK
jgi:hypothetical protein